VELARFSSRWGVRSSERSSLIEVASRARKAWQEAAHEKRTVITDNFFVVVCMTG
jgi:hypothetical protein